MMMRKIERHAQDYGRGRVTLARAAEDAGVSLWEMIGYVRQRKIPAQYGLEDLEHDLGVVSKRFTWRSTMQGKKFEIVVRAIVKDASGRILLVQRAKPPEQYKWSLPGGKVNFGETSDQAIKREIREELNLHLTSQLGFVKDDFTSVPGIHCLVLYFVGESIGDVVLKEDENVAYKWFSEEHIRQASDIAFDHQGVILGHLQRQRSRSGL